VTDGDSGLSPRRFVVDCSPRASGSAARDPALSGEQMGGGLCRIGAGGSSELYIYTPILATVASARFFYEIFYKVSQTTKFS